MTVPYHRFSDPAEATRYIREASARTVIFDVEPLIAVWDTDEHLLNDGVAAILDELRFDAGHLRHVVFATNSARRPPGVPSVEGLQISYLPLAAKPMHTKSYRDLPIPGVAIGDQIATDGVLAWRLGYTFLHYIPNIEAPLGPRLMGAFGRPLRRLLFHRS